MILVPSISPVFIIDPSPDGGVNLFRKASVGFVLVDTFDTPTVAREFMGEFPASADAPDRVNGAMPAAA